MKRWLLPTKNHAGQPPRGGWSGFVYPVDGHKKRFEGQYPTVDVLVQHIRRYEEHNGLEPLEYLELRIYEYFCKSCSFFRQFCREVEVEPKKRTLVEQASTLYEGAKAIGKINATSKLEILDNVEIEDNAKRCASCSLNYFKKGKKLSDSQINASHDSLYKHKLVGSYEVESLAEIATDEHKDGKVGTKCGGCGCNQFSKVYLHPEYYGDALVSNVHDINRLLTARIDHGDGLCWQLRAILTPELVELAKRKGSLTKKDLEKLNGGAE